MRRGFTFICAILILIGYSWARKRQPAPEPTSFAIGRHTFFDSGPPHNFYEIFVVSGTASGTSVKKMILTPGVDACTLPAKVETSSASLKQPISELLGAINPCSISEKDLHRELKRCKKCLVFSYVDVSMQVQCGPQSRLIQSKILDKDMFDPRPNTPKNTSWTMQLLSRLDEAVGPGVMNQPMFLFADAGQPATENFDSAVLSELGSGKYDELFPNAPDKPSTLYVDASKPRPHPSVRLASVDPFTPENIVMPSYPNMAALAHVQGQVSLTFYIGSDHMPTGVSIQSGSPLLRGAVTKAVSRWRFKEAGSLQIVHATVAFELNCPIQAK
jgi:TonB-like protein